MRQDIDIVLITYNRAETGLKRTLEALLSNNSPVSGCAITVLDNASTDLTKEVLENMAKGHSNVLYKRNKFNCGIAGNIIKAIELADKKWLWIICDDDEFDWTAWPEIDAALDENYDIVHTTFTKGRRSEEYSQLINEEAFIPTCIYNTKLIDGTVMSNAYLMAYTLFPHHAIGCKVLNRQGKIFVPHGRCVIQHYDNDKLNYIRASRDGVFHRLNNYQLLVGYVGAYNLLQDSELRKQCVSTLCLGSSFGSSVRWFLRSNPNHDLFNIYDFLAACQGGQILAFLFNLAYCGEWRVVFIALLTVIIFPVGLFLRVLRISLNWVKRVFAHGA